MESKLKIKGEYSLSYQFNVPLQGTVELNGLKKTNIITNDGEQFILKRLYKDNPNGIKYIAIAKEKETLTDGIHREITNIQLENRSITFKAVFTTAEMENVVMIALTNQEKGRIYITNSSLGEAYSKLPDGVIINLNYKLTLGD